MAGPPGAAAIRLSRPWLICHASRGWVEGEERVAAAQAVAGGGWRRCVQLVGAGRGAVAVPAWLAAPLRLWLLLLLRRRGRQVQAPGKQALLCWPAGREGAIRRWAACRHCPQLPACGRGAVLRRQRSQRLPCWGAARSSSALGLLPAAWRSAACSRCASAGAWRCARRAAVQQALLQLHHIGVSVRQRFILLSASLGLREGRAEAAHASAMGSRAGRCRVMHPCAASTPAACPQYHTAHHGLQPVPCRLELAQQVGGRRRGGVPLSGQRGRQLAPLLLQALALQLGCAQAGGQAVALAPQRLLAVVVVGRRRAGMRLRDGQQQ